MLTKIDGFVFLNLRDETATSNSLDARGNEKSVDVKKISAEESPIQCFTF